jgi:hypothetical protein
MKCSLVFANTAVLFALSWSDFPSFDGQAALVVGAIVAVAVVVVIVVAVATPFIAIQAGATILGTALAITGIAVVSGLIAGAAAGVYWGGQGDIKRQEQVQSIMRVSNQLDIYFEPSSGDSRKAADFECTLVVYEETDLVSRQPSVTTRRSKVTASNSDEFYSQLDDQMKKWFGKRVEGDRDGQPRRVMISMKPYPGEGIYERLKQIAEQNGSDRSVVHRTEGAWVSALPQ